MQLACISRGRSCSHEANERHRSPGIDYLTESRRKNGTDIARSTPLMNSHEHGRQVNPCMTCHSAQSKDRSNACVHAGAAARACVRAFGTALPTHVWQPASGMPRLNMPEATARALALYCCCLCEKKCCGMKESSLLSDTQMHISIIMCTCITICRTGWYRRCSISTIIASGATCSM